MKIALLDTGKPPETLRDRWPDGYPGMMERLIGRPGDDFTAFDVQEGELPAAPRSFDAVFVMGSPAGVYEDHPWIPPLFEFLRRARGRTKLVGVCFGHQAMAQAFGGRVEKSQRGWGLGLHRYAVTSREPWMGGDEETIAIPVSHQDQIVELPPAARVSAASAFSPFGVLTYLDQPAISFQCHPEFEVDYAKALVERRRERGDIPDEAADAAVATLDQPNDTPRAAGWIRRFLES